MPRTKRIAIRQNRNDTEKDHTDVNTNFLSTELLLKTTTRKNEILVLHG